MLQENHQCICCHILQSCWHQKHILKTVCNRKVFLLPLCRIRDCNCSFLSIFWTVRCNSFTCFFERWFNFNEPNCFGGIENGILWTFNMYKTIELLLFFPVVYKVTYPFWAGKLVFFVFKIIWLVPGEFLSLDACRRCSKALRRWIGEIRIRFLSCRLQKLSWD